jgi:hypothetical protein
MTADRERRLEAAAQLYDEGGEEFDRAAAHSRTVAGHFRAGEIPRGAAHAWAVRGHVVEAHARLDEQARRHAQQSHP